LSVDARDKYENNPHYHNADTEYFSHVILQN